MEEKLYESYGYVGTEKPRAYYIPFASREEWNDNREDSSAFTSLCGKWKISAYESFAAAELDLATAPTMDIDVPSCVQYYGLDYFQYTNTEYPIPFDPPHVPGKNPTYHYRRYFNAKKAEKQYMIFEGVDSCFYLYVNDRFVGFSQISHRVSEFDVTDYIKDGENKVDVLVLKWCAGTYFEDQDKWRFTGIFREVYLLSRPEKHVTDYKIETARSGDVTFKLLEGCDAVVSFLGEEKTVKEGESVVFHVENPHLWSAETPYLYDLDIKTEGEFIREKVGIREISIENGCYLINGQPVKLRGVNRHDFHPEKGAAVSLDDIITDLTLMKHLNVNAIRTSHYPSCPEFFRLCDKYGFYVLDEADLESHGAGCSFPGRPEGFLSDISEYEHAMVERQVMLVTRDKNRPCVIMWSMGNECGWGKNFYACSHYIKNQDKTRPVHYERVTSKSVDAKTGECTPRFPDYATAPVDVVSRMYASPEFMRDYFLTDKEETRPFVQCEYSHAMGNGPGDLKDYWDVIYSSDRFMGGFVWEWADHGVLYNTKGFRYGGDFGETLHSGEFCIDGIVSPDRKIKTGTLEMKKAYEPVKMELSDGNLVVTSRNYFADIVCDVEITYKDYVSDNIVETATIAIQPCKSATIPLSKKDACYIGVKLKTVSDEPLVEKGHVFASQAFTKDVDMREKLTSCDVVMSKAGTDINVRAGELNYVVDGLNGEIKSVAKNGKNIFKDKITMCVYRAYTDNDRNVKSLWKEQRLDLCVQDAYSVTITAPDEITVDGKVASEKNIPVVKFTLRYKFFAEGVKTSVKYVYTPLRENSFLPRIGLKTVLDKGYDKIKFYGYGPQESYMDKRFACEKDVFETTTEQSFVHYIRPQENGSHYGTNFAEICNGENTVRLQNSVGFSFCASPYSIETIEKTAHDDELPVSDATYLNADYFMSGIGSNSCGPTLNERYRVPNEGESEIEILIK